MLRHLFIAAVLTASCAAQSVLITSPVTLSPGAAVIRDQATNLDIPLATADITVRGATLTINGRHSIHSLRVEAAGATLPGTVTHTAAYSYDYSGGAGTDVIHGMYLIVAQNVTVVGASAGLPASAINLDTRGYGPASGPGAGGSQNFANATGGSHAGYGGIGSTGTSQGACYGSITVPTDHGSGGGNSYGVTAGRGGGCARLSVGGTLSVDGTISADGGAGLNSNGQGGGGSGGSIFIECGELAGSGIIRANGGDSGGTGAGGGGGGRVSITAATDSFAGARQASGGTGYVRGGAGTILTHVGNQLGTVTIDNDGATGENTGVPIPTVWNHHVIVRNGGRLGPKSGQTNCDLTVNGNVTIEPSGGINADTRGYGPAQGPGAGGSQNFANASGGGYGGHGGKGSTGTPIGSAYGSVFFPTDLGSGGGNSYNITGGRGGGAMSLTVGGTLRVDGAISANGAPGTASNGSGGGGSGGSLKLSCVSLEGTGTIAADGGSGASAAGGGGGGRIAIDAASDLFSGIFTARGGDGYVRGGAGTVYRKVGSNRGTIFVDNGNPANTGEVTGFLDPTTLDANIEISNGARVGPSAGQTDFDLTISGDAIVHEGGSFYADFRGYGPAQGPGAGGSGNFANASGGGYGGSGGAGSSNRTVGPVYGSLTSPADLGSGGGNSYGITGGRGGGAIRLSIGGRLHVDGSISATGEAGIASYGHGGGGSGGTLNITCGTLEGTGQISALGGSGETVAGGGGGGRIAIYSCNVTVPQANILASGGTGYHSGQPGSIYFGSSSVVITDQPDDVLLRGGDYSQISVHATGNGDLSYQWRRRNADGEYIALTEGDRNIFYEVHTDTLFVSSIDCAGGGVYDCLVCDSCGCFPTRAAQIAVTAPGDFNQDGGDDGADVEAFFAAWEAGSPDGDINLDGGIDGADVDFFFRFWEAGC